MRPKTIKILYWMITILFVFMTLSSGIMEIIQNEDGKINMERLGYPIYLLIITGVAKIVGAVAIVQTKYRTIKEWAYAGFTINFIGSVASHLFVGDKTGMLISPVIALVIMFASYFLWKKNGQLNTKD